MCCNCINQVTSQSAEGWGWILLQKMCMLFVSAWCTLTVHISLMYSYSFTPMLFSLCVIIYLFLLLNTPLCHPFFSFLLLCHLNIPCQINCFIRKLNNSALRQKQKQREGDFSYFVTVTISSK